MTKKRGFTLVELIIAMVVASVVMLAVGGFLRIGILGSAQVMDESEFQSQMRVTSERLNNTIRNSTVTFAVPQQVFENRKEKWNYIGLEKNSEGISEVVNYLWNDTTKTHDRTVIGTSKEGTNLGLEFKKHVKKPADKISNMIEFTFRASTDNVEHQKMEVKTEVQALNSLVVEDGGTDAKPATALAYRNDPTPTPETATTEVVVAVSLVLDMSGSMSQDMWGRTNGYHYDFDPNNIRIDIMKEKTQNLIKKFADMPNAYISLVPFSSNANGTVRMLNASKHQSWLSDYVSRISANGGTNTGDALRQAYYQLETFSKLPENRGKEILYFVIMLTDGNPTLYSGYQTYDYSTGTYVPYSYQINSGYCIGPAGTGRIEDTNIGHCLRYVKVIADNKILKSPFDITSHIIGFSAVPSDISRVQAVADYCTSSTNDKIKGEYHSAANADDLDFVYNNIIDNIVKETWHIYGPY